jgi:hypothetical protein
MRFKSLPVNEIIGILILVSSHCHHSPLSELYIKRWLENGDGGGGGVGSWSSVLRHFLPSSSMSLEIMC